MAEMITGVIMSLVVKEIRGSKAGMDLIGMIEDLMIEDTSLGIVQNENFSRADHRNRGSSKNFSRGHQRQGGRLNVLRVRDEQNDQSQWAKDGCTD
ncbi:hypothetical protein TNCV_1166331 [Trichonephila clavipes]|uniref:Uncharacterized protein n=1 Tax=Trichonephila clavipes TaxID=2585209 RepID=A0A8X6VT82_TRICX|nr:hypothetical protein TNCV_1166331 [Trichonephila clavipes]